MKIFGIILVILGCVSTFGGIMAAIGGHKPNFTGIGLVVLGAYLIYRANKKKEEDEEKKKWIEGKTKEDK
ncbi:hypothetical protein [Myroides odoratimimus]|uniref:hypothetical protein n=1 Tax=Myroides odoratimimus TaxID=76832 RepID=UPI0025779189|nr:hypothetical protein [Myroides odoratimimus]MDM1085860.1 hypothetical protein [Myroides odoratimimus]